MTTKVLPVFYKRLSATAFCGNTIKECGYPLSAITLIKKVHKSFLIAKFCAFYNRFLNKGWGHGQ